MKKNLKLAINCPRSPNRSVSPRSCYPMSVRLSQVVDSINVAIPPEPGSHLRPYLPFQALLRIVEPPKDFINPLPDDLFVLLIQVIELDQGVPQFTQIRGKGIEKPPVVAQDIGDVFHVDGTIILPNTMLQEQDRCIFEILPADFDNLHLFEEQIGEGKSPVVNGQSISKNYRVAHFEPIEKNVDMLPVPGVLKDIPIAPSDVEGIFVNGVPPFLEKSEQPVAVPS
ncbi:MAG: hypothetical protein ACUVWZ_15855 [Anaerolineae bacterium]